MESLVKNKKKYATKASTLAWPFFPDIEDIGLGTGLHNLM